MAVDYEEGRRLLKAKNIAFIACNRWPTDIRKNILSAATQDLKDFLFSHAEALLNPDPWRPISEAPTDGKSVLLACDYDRHGKQRVSLAWWDDQFDKSEISGCWIEGWFYDYQEDENTPMRVEFRPTHWKPLPTPPEKEGPGQ